MAYLFVFKDREGNVHSFQTWHPRVPRNPTTTLLSRESHRTADTHGTWESQANVLFNSQIRALVIYYGGEGPAS